MAIILVDQFLSVCKIRHKRFYYKNLARKATLFPRQRVSVQMRIAGNDFPAPSPEEGALENRLSTNPGVLPSAFEIDPLIVSSLPPAFYPDRIWPWRAPPSSGNPSITMTPRVPLVITGNPDPAPMRRMNDHHFLLRRGRTNIDPKPDVDLCGSRNCRGKTSCKNGDAYELFHI